MRMVKVKNALKNANRIWYIFGFFVFLGFALYLAYMQWDLSHDDSFDYTLNTKSASNDVLSCDTSQTIEYLYYLPEIEEKRNNKFGLYIYAENRDHLTLAEELVNSNGGDWGYVLLPFNVRDRDRVKWTSVFTRLREKHLIPIIQLHDVNLNRYEDETKGAAEFLDDFVWPVRQRYISVYNEPNDAKFWYGKVDPREYARILDYTVETFKKTNRDFFMLNGAFNVSAPNSGTYMDSFDYMAVMNDEVPGIFEKLDGWASHPYPQPNFSGSPHDSGRWSIKAYEDELKFLESELGVSKDLPVFITETGWAHAEGQNYDGSFLPAQKVAENLKIAYEQVWLPDDRVVAVTPFTIWYDPPFDHFSWVNKDLVPYIQFEVIKSMKKVEGTPQRLQTGRISSGCRN